MQLLRQINKFRKKKKIQELSIKIFYEQPNKFFSDSHILIENTSFIYETETSILSLYFYILYDKHKNRSFSSINYSIYESNFDSFFKENHRYF